MVKHRRHGSLEDQTLRAARLLGSLSKNFMKIMFKRVLPKKDEDEKKILKPHPGAFFLLMRKWSIWVEGRSSHILSVIAKGNSRFPAVLLTTFSFEQLFFKKKTSNLMNLTFGLISSVSPPKEILVAGKLPDKIFIAPHASASAPTWSKEKHFLCYCFIWILHMGEINNHWINLS